MEKIHEPFLTPKDYLQRTPQGRVLTSKAWQLLGIDSTHSH
ncbi:MAG: hypothetical protein LBF34_00080 [Puniceicoccales bacterium]|nr:hypothetical protein [Puniceicoccales bacterium]